jgi:hypothetical protein
LDRLGSSYATFLQTQNETATETDLIVALSTTRMK